MAGCESALANIDCFAAQGLIMTKLCPVLRGQARLNGDARRPDGERMPRARPLRDRRVRLPWLDADQGDDLIVIEHGHEGGHPEFIRDGRELGERRSLQVARDPAGERRHAWSKSYRASGIPDHQTMIFEGAYDAVRDGAVHAERGCERSDTHRVIGLGQDLENADTTRQRL